MSRGPRPAFRAFVFSLAAALVLAAALPEAQGRGGGQGGGRGGGGVGPGAGPGLGPGGGGGRGQGRGPVRDNAEGSALGTGIISGRVVLDGPGTPVRRARVVLSGAELGGARTTLTDEQGTFTFQLLPAGRFTMTASKAGFVDGTFGSKRAGRPGTPIQLTEGQQLDKMTITMPRGGVITGVVIDENGEPSPGTQVRAMRAVIRTGEKALQQAGQDQTDDRGIYRIYQLQPGDYVVSAVPRNMNIGDLRDVVATQAAQLQTALSNGGRGGALAAAGVDLSALGANVGPAAQQILDRLSQLQGLGANAPQPTVYAPVYYPGTTSPAGASTLTLGIGEERTNVDFQLQLVATAKIDGSVSTMDGGALPQGTQVALVPTDRSAIPGLGLNVTRVDASGHFVFRDVTPGLYAVQARAAMRKPVEGNAGGRAFGPGRGGGRGAGDGSGFLGPMQQGQIEQVLWAAADVAVNGQDVTGLSLALQPGLRVSGRVEFQGTATVPADLTRVRVSLNPRGQQTFDLGGLPPADVEADGRFTITGVAPGRYALTGTIPPGGGPAAGLGGANGQPAAVNGAGRGARAGGAAPGTAGTGWSLKSAIVDGRDVLDFPLEVGSSGGDVSNATLIFTDKTQELSGTIQDATGRPAPDFTIIVFSTDTRYWMPQARRINATRPGTDGKFTLRGLPAGDYRMTAVTDVEPGEWFDPAFLTQLQNVSIPISLREGEKKVQDVKLASAN